MTQSAERQTLDFGSGHDLVVGEFKSSAGLCAGSVEPAWDSLSLSLSLSVSVSLCPSPALTLSLSKINKR